MKKEYRIVKKYWRDNEIAKIKNYYIIEYWGATTNLIFYKKYGWKIFKREVGFMEHSWKKIVEFNTLQKAKDYIINLKKPIPEDKIIYK